MSSTYSAASEDLALGSNAQECEQSRSVKSSPIASECSPSIGQASPAMTTLEPLQQTLWNETELPLTLSVVGSRAKTSHSLEGGLASRVRDLVCGVSTGDLLASYDPALSSLRTCQASLVSDWETFSETLPRSGMMLAGNVYQRVPLALPTDGTDGGSWPTPRKNDAEKRGQIANDPRNGLPAAAMYWPTPVKRDCRTIKGAKRAPNATGSEPLTVVVGLMEGTTIGALNPTWVEWLMGFPLGWTALERSETPSSRKSRK